MRCIHFLVEEPSAEAALRNLLPRLLANRARFIIINLGSKQALLKKLVPRLRAYADLIQAGEDLRVVVLVDRDNDNCAQLKDRLEQAASDGGLVTKRSAKAGKPFHIVTRIAVEELESWFLGDPDALRATFPRLPSINTKTAPFRNPENGGSWEALHRFLRKHGYYPGTYQKIDAARRIAANLSPDANRTPSFGAFCRGIEACT